ncbi:MAG: HesB/IscA family protein, partial [Blastomonas fulva]
MDTTATADIILTPSAASRVAAIAAKQGKPAVLRLSVEGGGCSGFQYRFGLADAPEDGDTVALRDGVALVVDEMSLD